jgi:DNA-directed RNA polymerase specialized sigma24 family protein
MSRAGGLAALRGDEEQLYRDHHRRLASSVRWAVQADPALIEAACARAWEQLIRHQPQRTERIFAWLRTVAIREASALARREEREAGQKTTTRTTSDAAVNEEVRQMRPAAARGRRRPPRA